MEYKRIFINKKVIGLIAILCISVVVLYLYNNRYFSKKEYIENQSNHVTEYEEYINTILEQGDNLLGISIFQDVDSYSYKNIKKTYNDYNKISNVKLIRGDYQSVESVFEFSFAEVACAFFAIIIVWSFFEDEKKGLKTIVYSTCEGRHKLAFKRIGILAFSSVLFVLFIYLLILGISLIVYGMPDTLSAPIQSLLCCKSFTGEVSIWMYFLVFVFVHILKTICFGMLVWMVMCFNKNRVVSIGVLLVILIVEGVLCFKIPVQSSYVILKYINVFRLIYFGEILSKYENISVFGDPVSVCNAFLIFVVVLILIASAVCVIISHFKKTIRIPNRMEMRVIKFCDAIIKSVHRILSNMNLFQMEIYKLLINQKGIIVLFVWIVLLFSQVDSNNVFLMGNKNAMSEIYEEYSGVDDDRLREYFETNYSKLSDFQIQKIDEQLSYIDRVKREQDIDVWFMDQKPYNVLWSENGLYLESEYEKQEIYGILVVALIVLLPWNVFAYDNTCGLKKVIHSTIKGRDKLFNLKVGTVFVIAFVSCFIVYGIELIEINNIYPMSCYSAPVQSVSCMEKFPFKITVLEYLIFLELVHLLCSIAIAFIALAIKECIGNLKGLIISLVVLIAPGVLKLLGFEWSKNISVIQPLIFVESYADYGFIFAFVQVSILIIISVFSLLYLREKWCRSR